jgi:hypothetical protein
MVSVEVVQGLIECDPLSISALFPVVSIATGVGNQSMAVGSSVG